MEQHWILIDGNSGLHVPWYFWLRVLDEVNRSTRYGTPFGLLLLEATPKSLSRSSRALNDALTSVPQAIRSTDLGGLLGTGRVGVLLTNQDDASAEQARDRILERLSGSGAMRHVDWAPRLLTFPRDAAEISTLLTEGWQVVEADEAKQSA